MPVHIYATRSEGESSPKLMRPAPDALPGLLADPAAHVWVDVQGSTDEYLALMRDVLLLHPLLIEDAFKPQDTPKLETHEDYAYFIVHGPVEPAPGGELEGVARVGLADVDLFVGERFLITHHEGGVPALVATRDLVAHEPRLLAEGPAVVAHRVVDHMIDRFMVKMNQVGESLDALELLSLESGSPEVLEQIFAKKREVVAIGRLARHQREVLRMLATGPNRFIPSDQRPFFRDIYDHFIKIGDQAEAYRDMVSDALDGYLSMQSHRLNDVMKMLTLISTIMLPLTFITGLYGMNFDYMPGLHHEYGYQMAWFVMIGTATAIFLYFKRKRWW